MSSYVTLRSLSDSDVPLFKKWLFTPHVLKWYHDSEEWIYEVENRNDRYSWINHFIVECDGFPIGFCQYYEYKKSGEDWHGNADTDNAYSIDYLIGEADYLRKGFGKQIIINLIELIRNEKGARSILVQPESENIASRKTLVSAGFKYDEKNDIYLIEL